MVSKQGGFFSNRAHLFASLLKPLVAHVFALPIVLSFVYVVGKGILDSSLSTMNERVGDVVRAVERLEDSADNRHTIFTDRMDALEDKIHKTFSPVFTDIDATVDEMAQQLENQIDGQRRIVDAIGELHEDEPLVKLLGDVPIVNPFFGAIKRPNPATNTALQNSVSPNNGYANLTRQND